MISACASPPAKTASLPSKIEEMARVADLPKASKVQLPEITDQGETIDYLEKEGAVLLKMHASVAELLVHFERCRNVGRKLDKLGGPRKWLEAAAGIPDEPTRAMWSNARSATQRYLSFCQVDSTVNEFPSPGNQGKQEAANMAAWYWTVLERRLDQLGIAH